MTRFLLKQFAGNANNNGVFGSYEAGTKIKSNDPDTIQSLPAFSTGWLDSTTQATQLPALEELQGLEYLTFLSIRELYSEGIPQWLSTEEYQLNSFCVYDGVIYKNITGNYTTSNPSIDDTNWEELKTGGSSRNIGELVTSLVPLIDASLHLLDGDLIDGTGTYKNFYNYILDLYNSGNYSFIFETEANWQTSVTTYGVCGKFVIDTVNQTVRLPKITGFIEGTNTLADLGKLTEAGLPDHDHTYTDWTKQGAIYASTGETATNIITSNTSLASASNPVYGNSNTVQPQSIKVLFYIVIATSVKTDIEIDIDEITNDLNNKANKDGSNATFSNLANTAKDNILDFTMPQPTNNSGVAGEAKRIMSELSGSLSVPNDGTWLIMSQFSVDAGNADLFDYTSDRATNDLVVAGGTLIRNARTGDYQVAYVLRIR